MAAIEPSAPKAGKKPRARKHSFRIDMTPMVDLAFLLLTFFMLTTTFAKPYVIKLTMPTPTWPGQETPIPESQAVTVVLGQHHKVHYYFGLNDPSDLSAPLPILHTTDFSAHGIRQILLARRKQQPAPVVLIKAGARAKYSDMVDILDEMNITGQQKYAITELSAADRQLLPPSERQ